MPVDVEVNVISSPVSGDCGANENDAVGAACAEGAAIHIVIDDDHDLPRCQPLLA